MIQYTPENTIILYVFQTLLAGLILLVAAWQSLQRPSKSEGAALPVAFFFFSGFALLRSLFTIGFSQGLELPDASWPFLLVCTLETIFLGSLLIWVSPRVAWKKALAIASLPALAAYMASRELLFTRLSPTFESFYQAGPLHLFLTLTVLAVALKRFRPGENWIPPGLAFFAASYLAETFFCFYLPSPVVWLWNLQQVTKILGLFCFALHLEKECSHIYVQFFVRLNLVFILSANIFMLLLSETERRQYLDFSAAQVQDLAEFLRGHVIYFQGKGLTPAAIVRREEIDHKIVSEFGRIPALKQVKLQIDRQQLLMSIDAAGVISYQAGTELFPEGGQSIYNYTEKTVSVLRIPIVVRGQSIGFLQFDEDLLLISRKIAGQMQLIFSSFTIVVFVTLGALGFIVSKAEKTIRRQYSALQEKQEELIQASRLASIGELVDGVAHEVNNPTGVILIRSECALAVLPQQQLPSVREDLEEIRLQAGRMTKLVRNLLAFSRAAPVREGPVDLNQVVRRSLDLVSAYLRIAGIHVQLHLAPELPCLRGDADRLEQVVVNLVKNAADAMPRGGTLSCKTQADHDFALLTVADTGSGISADVLEKIFNPFFTTKTPGQGTGLGLSISHSIIRDHGGRIEVHSEPGRGTVFTVYLPWSRR